MSTLKTMLILSGLYCVLAFENTAVGQVDIVFSDGTTTGTTFNVDVGTTQTISVIAAETETGTALSTDGLNGFGFLLDASATSGTASEITSFTANPAFSGGFGTEDDVTATSLGQRRLIFANVPGTSVPLGDVDISVTAPGTTVFTLSDFSNLLEFGTSGGEGLDPVIFQGNRTFSFTINAGTAIPEPSGGLLIGFSMLATMIRRKRNRS